MRIEGQDYMTAREFGALGATSKISFVKDSACAHFSVAQATIGDYMAHQKSTNKGARLEYSYPMLP